MKQLLWLAVLVSIFTLGQNTAVHGQTPGAAASSSPLLNPAMVSKGEAVYKKLKHDHPDAAMLPDHDLAPHTIDIWMTHTFTQSPLLDLSMPTSVWNKLSPADKDALVALLRSKIKEAREYPEKFASTPPAAPAYPAEIANIRSTKDDSWEISVGHLDSEGYLEEDKVVLKGDNYVAAPAPKPNLIYADAKTDPVYNSHLDGSVRQVVDYLGKTLNDPDSIKYSNWTDVIKTGTGYQVSVTYRAKNAFNAYVSKDQTISFDKKGEVTRVIDNY